MREDKSDLLEVFYGELKQAPLIELCPINIECKLSEIVELPTNTFFIGEVLNVYSKEDFLTDGKPDVKKVNPFLLTMPDNRFWSVGDNVGRAWNAGAKYREQLNQKNSE